MDAPVNSMKIIFSRFVASIAVLLFYPINIIEVNAESPYRLYAKMCKVDEHSKRGLCTIKIISDHDNQRFSED